MSNCSFDPDREQHHRAVGRKRRVVFGHLVVGQLLRVRSVRIHQPHFGAVAEFEQRARHPRHGDALAIGAQLIAADVPVTFGDSFRLAIEVRRPEVALLEVVFLKRIHVVANRVLVLFIGGLVIGGDEIDRLAVRRPCQIAWRGRVIGEPPRLTALDTST